MKKDVLYPDVKRPGQSFKGSKVCVVPNQSMGLAEILRRFVKRESLPQSKEGVYEDRYDYDLEKLSKADLTEQHEVINKVKQDVKRFEKEINDDNAAKAKALAA